VHLHSSNAGAVGRLAFPFGGGVKIIYTPRAYGFLQLDLKPWKIVLYRVIEKVLGKFPHTTIACGQGEYELAKNLARKTEVINNSISTDYLDEIAGQRAKNKRFTVLSAGRISYQKNFPQFVEVAKAFEGQDIDFVWVGGAVPEKVVLTSNIKVTGWMDYTDSVKLIASADLYVQTSLWEGLSLTVLEAMGLGLPVLLSDAVGNKEMVVDGQDGFVCPLTEDFIQKITLLKGDAALREGLGHAARAKIKTEYNYEGCKQQWLLAYEVS
jgi:glycosyltransferase involved in cell wall biosynthesis